MTSPQAGSLETHGCINDGNAVSDVIGDLDTIIMLATADTLQTENDSTTFSEHRDNILKAAKALIEDTKVLIAGAFSSQEQLIVVAQNALTSFKQLDEVVKYAAASLESNNCETQVHLIGSLKCVATALRDVVVATKAAVDKSIHHQDMKDLRVSAKVMVTSVISLLKTVSSVADEYYSKGSDSLEEEDMQQARRANIIRLEKELEVAKEKLSAIRKSNRSGSTDQ